MTGTRREPSPATDDARWERLEALFDAALEVPEPERAAWLAAACPDDPALRAEVARMLDGHRRSGGVLERAVPTPDGAAPGAAGDDGLRERLAAALGERYAIEEELGRGGMAVVFRAEERKHARPVVLKVLKPEVALLCGTQRFAREVRIAARLAHPHIVPLIDSGDAGSPDGGPGASLLYYVMAYMPGETLRARLRAGPLGTAAALSLLGDVAEALAHAHRAGVVHRDLKPENVLCAGMHAYLLDFGIATLTAFDRAAPEGGAPENGAEAPAGGVVGTPAYMAPEQQAGGAVDARADVYAWGLLAYEMLVGRTPAARGDVLPALRARPDLPVGLAELIHGCLAPSPADRPADGDALVAGLTPLDLRADPRRPATGWWTRRRAGAGALLAAGTLAAAGLVLTRRGDRPVVPDGLATPIAVAAFTNETGDPRLDSWGRMAGDWITQGLQEVGAAVVPWSTALGASERMREARAGRAAPATVDPVAYLHAETGARTVVTGSYYLVGDSLRVLASVVSAVAAGVPTERALGALPAVVVHRDSAPQAVRLLRDRLMAAVGILSSERLATVPELAHRPPTFDAYVTFDRALQRFVAQEYGPSAPDFRRAHALDTTFLPALLYAATAYWNTAEFARADTIARLLRERRGALSAYHAEWADYLDARLAGDGTRALTAARAAAERAPTSRAAFDYAQLALDMDRPREALAALDRMDPDRGDMRGWSSYWTQRTHAQHLLGAHDRELADARELRTRFPDRRVGLVLEVRARAAAAARGDAAALAAGLAALDSLVAAARTLPPTTYWSAGAAMVVAGEELIAHGRPAEGRPWLTRGVAWLRDERARSPGERAHRYWLGMALYHLGEWSEAAATFRGLARDYPDRLQYRGLAALGAARLDDPRAAELLGTAAPHERGEMAAYRARIAAVRGERGAAGELADAVRDGIDGLPWLHATAFEDLALLGTGRAALPASLGASRRRF